jgi:hypothetical protein
MRNKRIDAFIAARTGLAISSLAATREKQPVAAPGSDIGSATAAPAAPAAPATTRASAAVAPAVGPAKRAAVTAALAPGTSAAVTVAAVPATGTDVTVAALPAPRVPVVAVPAVRAKSAARLAAAVPGVSASRLEAKGHGPSAARLASTVAGPSAVRLAATAVDPKAPAGPDTAPAASVPLMAATVGGPKVPGAAAAAAAPCLALGPATGLAPGPATATAPAPASGVESVPLFAPGAPSTSDMPSLHSRPARKKKSRMKKRRYQLALAVATLAAIGSVSVGATLAIYSNRPTGETNTFVAGTVSLTNVATGACTASTNNMAPTDTATCTLASTYAGNLSGYMGVDVFIATQKNTAAGAGGASATDLYNPADSTNEAQITVSSTTPTVSYVTVSSNFGTAITCPAAGASLDGVSYTTYDKCYLISNFLVSATPFSSGTVTFTTGITLPSAQPNTYQGSSAVVVVAAHAVQSRNNAVNCTVNGTTPTAGQVCTPAGSFLWS